MLRLSVLVCAALAMSLSGGSPPEFSKYRKVEAYEVRPGVFMFPTYSSDGQVCELALERRHYSGEAINLDPTFSREEIIKLIDELAPISQRGPLTMGVGTEYLSERSGGAATTFSEYENVSIHIYGWSSNSCARGGDVAAAVRWKKRKCNYVSGVPRFRHGQG